MSAKFIDTNGLGTPLQVWLAHDDYDHDPRPNAISVTGLMRPIRQIMLQLNNPTAATKAEELNTRLASARGSAIHNSIEQVWEDTVKRSIALANIGTPEVVIKRVRINPSKEDLASDPSIIPVYLEQRSEKVVGNYIITGKFDMVFEGEVNDHKSTGTYTYTKSTKGEDYIRQGSIYRWLNPDIITKPNIVINFIFNDWVKFKANQQDYPPSNPCVKRFPLDSIAKTETWIIDKLALIDSLRGVDQSALPQCSAKELWMDASKFAYYANPLKNSRATKIYATRAEAESALAAGKYKGVVEERRSKARACSYCPSAGVCTQREQLGLNGLLS